MTAQLFERLKKVKGKQSWIEFFTDIVEGKQ